jgi:hypothetical protein
MGQGRHHSVVGEWEIRKAVVVQKDKAPFNAAKGKLHFSDKGLLAIDLESNDDKTTGEGTYAVTGPLVLVNGLTSTASGAGGLPPTMKMRLSWQGADRLVALVDGGEALFMTRHPKGNPLVSMFQMGLRHDKEAIPGEMRGIISTMKDKVGANEADN